MLLFARRVTNTSPLSLNKNTENALCKGVFLLCTRPFSITPIGLSLLSTNTTYSGCFIENFKFQIINSNLWWVCPPNPAAAGVGG
jgi:hypothetical protein